MNKEAPKNVLLLLQRLECSCFAGLIKQTPDKAKESPEQSCKIIPIFTKEAPRYEQY